ncbi:beta-ketoacyl synthase chain length factor, partial [Ralstonia pseudosolanacearum]|nr:beta-ketoacyl synthase chain length factor [Ralstonia pseudosolanacearum]
LPELRVVFASRHGELRRSTSVLDDIGNAEPVSPTAFSLSVLNAMSGIFSIARRDNAAATAISAGPGTLGWALLEAYAQYVSDPGCPVLLVYADEPADPRYGVIDDEITEGALAILLDASAPAMLDCSRDTACSRPTTRLRTQSEAVLHCLRSRTSGAWEHPDGVWQWHWREGAWQAD